MHYTWLQAQRPTGSMERSVHHRICPCMDDSPFTTACEGKHQKYWLRQRNRSQVGSPYLFEDIVTSREPAQPEPMHVLKLVIKEEALPLKEQPEFPALAELAKRGLLAPDAWSCKRAQISLKATIDVPMLGTIIEQNGDGLLEQSHMPVGWPLHIDGAVRQSCAHQDTTLQELDNLLGNTTWTET